MQFVANIDWHKTVNSWNSRNYACEGAYSFFFLRLFLCVQ